MTIEKPIRVMLADDHEMVRFGLASCIRMATDMELVGEAANGEETVELCAELQPDVILMDMMMPRMNGAEAMKIIHQEYPQIRIIAITSFEDDQMVLDALHAGATSYLHKNIAMSELQDIIRKSYAGAQVLSPEAVHALIALTGPKAIEIDLTGREKEVLFFMSKGLSNPEIADRLVISRNTVATHVSSILNKLGVKSRTEAVTLAFKNRLVPPP